MTQAGEPTIAVVVLTYNRVHLLRQCVENVLGRTSDRTTEIVIWNNASTDGTREYLDSLSDPRISVVHWPKNIGQNAYDRAFAQTTAPYLLELDDDVIDAPQGWDATLLHALPKLPEFGFLAANLANNPHDVTAQIMYGRSAGLYHIEEINGFRLKIGPTGGWCGLTPRELYTRVGGFGRNRSFAFWHEDAAYIGKVTRLGLRAALLADLEVVHAGGPHYAPVHQEKWDYYTWRDRRQARKNAVKRMLLALPLVPRLNKRYGWFQPPAE